jgi:hypothetical protein
MEWMDWKDQLEKQSKKEFFPVQTAMFGFGAAAVLLTPFGWVAALGVGAVWGCNKIQKEWRQTRTLNVYGRTFILNSKGVVVGMTKEEDG